MAANFDGAVIFGGAATLGGGALLSEHFRRVIKLTLLSEGRCFRNSTVTSYDASGTTQKAVNAR